MSETWYCDCCELPFCSQEDRNGHMEYLSAVQNNADRWVPACGGRERPFTARNGLRLLYCYNPSQNRHAYINVDTDMEIDGYALVGAGL